MLKTSFLFFLIGIVGFTLGAIGPSFKTGLELFFACLTLAVVTFIKGLSTPSRT